MKRKLRELDLEWLAKERPIHLRGDSIHDYMMAAAGESARSTLRLRREWRNRKAQARRKRRQQQARALLFWAVP